MPNSINGLQDPGKDSLAKQGGWVGGHQSSPDPYKFNQPLFGCPVMFQCAD